MIVRELRAQLAELPDDLPVFCADAEWDRLPVTRVLVERLVQGWGAEWSHGKATGTESVVLDTSDF